MTVDVCVCGGGPAGWIAACAAAHAGKKVVMLEKNAYPGGLAAGGFVGPVSKCRMDGRLIIGGLTWEFLEAMHRDGAAIADLPSGYVPFDSEAYKVKAAGFLRNAGVHTFYGSTLCGVTAESGRVWRVRALCEGTLFDIEADYFIDATGNGSLLSLGGLPWQLRQEKNQPLSLVFKLTGVETDKIVLMKKDDLTRTFSADLRQILQQGMDEGKISGFGGPWSVWGAVIAPGMVSVNATRSAAVPSDPEQFSCACESMHREIPVIVELFRKFEPYRNARLAAVAPLVGVRENREAVTRHRIKFDELFVENEVTDSIALGGHPVDRHCAGTSAQNIEFLIRCLTVRW